MKTTILSFRLIVAAALLSVASVNSDAQIRTITQKVKSQVNKAAKKEVNKASRKATDAVVEKLNNRKGAKEYTVNGHTYSIKGNLSIEKYNSSATGQVTFTNIPSDYDEFKEVYTNFLGYSPQGTAAMMTMAMEIYARDSKVGEQCIKLISYPSNYNSVIRVLKTKFTPSSYSGENDPYVQRYLPAAVLDGATNTNAYTPNYPYTIKMKASVNQHQDMQLYDGRVMYIYVMGAGWDTQQRSVEVVQTSDSELLQVFNCPSLYTQCKNIKGTWGGLK